MRGWLAVAWLAVACNRSEPPPAAHGQQDITPQGGPRANVSRGPFPAIDPLASVTGTLTVDGVPARLVRCRPGHAVHVFVEVDTTLGTLRFGEGKLSWQGSEQACQKLDRSWGGGVRQDGTAYFRGTLAFRCGKLAGDLALDCGQISPREGAELARNRAAAKAQVSPPSGTPPIPPDLPAPAPAGSAVPAPGSATRRPGSPNL